MNSYIVYNGPDPSKPVNLFHRDYQPVEANSFAEALEKISADWAVVDGQMLFVLDTKAEVGHLVRVVEPTSRFTLVPVEDVA